MRAARQRKNKENRDKIILKTPIGDKIGTLAVKLKSGIIEGILNLFGAKNELISGEAHETAISFRAIF